MLSQLSSMKKLGIRPYQDSDLLKITQFMGSLYDYYVPLDTLARIKRQPGYDEVYTKDLLKKVNDTKGVIYIAQDGRRIIGFAACILIKPSEKSNLASVQPLTDGRVDKLFVDESYRGQGVGKALMKAAEDLFVQAECDLARVEVFVPNVEAHRFYEELGYRDRLVDMVKRL